MQLQSVSQGASEVVGDGWGATVESDLSFLMPDTTLELKNQGKIYDKHVELEKKWTYLF